MSCSSSSSSNLTKESQLTEKLQNSYDIAIKGITQNKLDPYTQNTQQTRSPFPSCPT